MDVPQLTEDEMAEIKKDVSMIIHTYLVSKPVTDKTSECVWKWQIYYTAVSLFVPWV